MKKAIRTTLIVLSVLAIVAPLLFLCAYAVWTPPVYDETPNAELADKFAYLYSVEGPKVVLISGSSMAYGMDSALLSERVGMPVVNFGLYASLGSRLMLDLSRDAIGEGDIVVFAPETDSQAYSLFFSARNTLQALDADHAMLFKIDSDNYPSLWGGLWEFCQGKLEYLRKGEKPDVSGTAMRRSNFNEYGDLDTELFPRNGLVQKMRRLGYDNTTPIRLSASIVSDDFVSFFNEYVKEMEKKGARVYFSFSPMNRGAIVAPDYVYVKGTVSFPRLTDDEVKGYADAFLSDLEELFDCAFISDPNDYIMEPKYFYDTNFHLNNDGVPVRTNQLADDILAALGNR